MAEPADKKRGASPEKPKPAGYFEGESMTQLMFAIANTPHPPIRQFKFVSPGFFKTMGTPLLAGREFTDRGRRVTW